MKTYYHFFIGLLCLVLAMSIFSCSPGNKKSNDTDSNSHESSIKSKEQLNISVFLDLSDRINPSKYTESPSPAERDLAAINAIVSCFKDDMEARGAFRAKGSIKVFFDPTPQVKGINQIAEKLDIDLSKAKDNKAKKEIFDRISDDFNSSLQAMYQNSISTQNWIGADIWGFFKRKAKDLCIRPEYRNILIIITDGYIYHEQSKLKSGNRYSYLLPETLKQLGLRKNPNWKEELEKQDFGLIASRQDLEDLEVLVLETRPEPNQPEDQDIIEEVLEKWFKEMHIKRYRILGSDLPANTRTLIRNFILANE